MTKTLLIVGCGPGVSSAVARKFGADGFSVALVARNPDRLAAGVADLKARGVPAAAFVADAADPDSLRGAIRKARTELGPISVLHWNAFSGGEAGDLLAIEPAAVGRVFDVAVVGLLAAVEEALPDLKSAGDGAVLVTNGAFGEPAPMMDAFAVSMNSMGVALANAAKAKLVGLLSARLKADGVYVGEVTIAGAIRGTPTDTGAGSLEGSAVAEKFWALYRARSEVRARVG